MPPQPTPRGEGGSPNDANVDVDRPRPAKRARVALACTRCKTRKQKCDGVQPSCSNCKNISTPCEYVISKSMPYGKYQYMKALETRVAELETLLANAGLTDSGKDHWDTVWQSEISNETSSPGPTREQTASRSLQNSSSKGQQASRDDPASILQHLKDLSLEADGGYVGDESSNITVGHMLRSIVQGKQPPVPAADPKPTLASPSAAPQNSPQPHLETASNYQREISDENAETLVKAYFKHISTRWVALYRPLVQSLHQRRKQLLDPFEISTLNLVYATGGRFLETAGEIGNYFSDQHYASALSHLDAVLQLRDIRSVQTLLLHAIYCLRAPRGLSAWTHVGVAIRVAIELGLHRKTSAELPSMALEIRKRLFWSCYCLDRQVSIILGRPFAISDHDIDAELPLDVDDNIGEEEFQGWISTPSSSRPPATSLSCFIHMIRLRRIESQIQQIVYRVDQETPIPITVIDHFILELIAWKESVPENPPLQDTEVYSFDGYLYYLIYYYKAMRFLLYPHVTGTNVESSILIKCADACGGVCRSYKTLHRQTSVGFSLMALYSIFLSGLTLVYCIWVSPKQVYTVATSDDLNSCSIVLYVIAERWPAAKKYRDAFESIKQGVLDVISSSDQPRNPLTAQDAELRATLEDVQRLRREGRADFSRMMTDMIGERNQASDLAVQQDLHGQFADFSNLQSGSDGSMFRFDQDPGAGNYLSMGAMGHGMVGEIGDMGMGQVPFGAVDFFDEFDMQDFMVHGYQFGDPMI